MQGQVIAQEHPNTIDIHRNSILPGYSANLDSIARTTSSLSEKMALHRALRYKWSQQSKPVDSTQKISYLGIGSILRGLLRLKLLESPPYLYPPEGRPRDL